MGTDTSKSLFKQALNEILAGNYIPAEHLLQQASEINEEGTSQYAASWAVLLAMRNRSDEAIEILEEKLEEHSDDPDLLLAYGIALEKQEKYEDAEDAFRESLENAPESPGALRGLSACLQRKGDVVGGCRLAAKAFTLAPDNLVLAKNAVELLEKAGQKETAFEVLDLGAHYNPEDEELVTKALESNMTRGDPDRTWELLTLVDESKPWAAGWKASFLDWRGEEERANQLIQKTLERPAGQDTGFLFHLSCVLMRRGQVGAAEAYLGHILENDPQHAGALRMKADFSVGRFEYNALIDPLGAAVAASTETPGWARFWKLMTEGDFDEAEETLGLMTEDESLMADAQEIARVELAEQLFLSLASGEPPEPELHALDDIPTEASCGVILEFLEVLDNVFEEGDIPEDFRDALNTELTQRDPVLGLTRHYALELWTELKKALDSFDTEGPMEYVQGAPDHFMIHRLYSFLYQLGTDQTAAVDTFDFEKDWDFASNVFDVLIQKRDKNSTEQRFLDKLQGEVARLNEVQVPDGADDSDTPYEAGSLLNTKDADIVVYETEDGEVLGEFDENEFEVVEAVDEEVEPDPEDDDYEYVWVEEEVEEDEEIVPVVPADTYTPPEEAT